MKPFVVHSSEKRFRCAFYTLVIRINALMQHYRGGLQGFMNEYSARCNNHIAVWCDMGSDINDAIDDLIASGLTMDEDFMFLDVASYSMVQSMVHKVDRRNYVDLGVNWLKGRYADGALYIWYVQGR